MTTSTGSATPRFQVWRADLHELDASCVRFGRLLRDHGVAVSPEQVLRWVRSLALLECRHPADLYWAGRVTLVSRREHLAVYDDLFRRFWLTLDHAALRAEEAPAAPGGDPPSSRRQPGRTGRGRPGAPGGDGAGAPPDFRGDAARWLVRWREAGSGPRAETAGRGPHPGADPTGDPAGGPDSPDPVPARYSAHELLRGPNPDLAGLLGRADLAAILRAAGAWWEPLRPARRRAPARRGRHVDLRRTAAAEARTGGEPVRLLLRQRRCQWRKWVFLCDVSGSMAPYALPLLQFLHAVALRRPATEVFLFGTRLSRITPQLRRARSGRVAGLVPQDAGGGTRLGSALLGFLRDYGRRGMAHGAALVVLSDGLDQGEAEETGRAMAALRRLARRIIWVNPLAARPGYRPEARAMAAALPHIDDLVSGHDPDGLADLLRRLVQDERTTYR